MPSIFWTIERRKMLADNLHLSDLQLAELLGSTLYAVEQARLRYRILRPKPAPFKEKTCPLCKVKKSVNEFERYFSKSRNSYRNQSYCKVCSPAEKCRRSMEYYKKKGEKVRSYQRRYRVEKRELIRPKKRAFNKKYRQEVHPLYAIDQIRQDTGLTASEIRTRPELIEVEIVRIKLKRKLKILKNEK